MAERPIRLAAKTKQARESAVVRRITNWLKTVPGLAFEVRHGTAFGHAGEPDISGCIQGRRFEIEVKRPGRGDAATPLQLQRLGYWQNAGAVVGVADTLEAAQRIVWTAAGFPTQSDAVETER